MKYLVPLIGCVVLTGCVRPASAAPEDPAAPAPPPAAVQAAPAPPSPVVVPVEDNRYGIPPAVYPPLPSRFDSAAAVTPPGWRIEHQVDGDLNSDRRPDLVLVLREQNPANIIEHDDLGFRPLDTNPRMLVVAFARDGGYELIARNHTFIPRHVEPIIEDALETAPEIGNGVLSVRLYFFASAGGWSASNSTARIRWQDGALRLIGHDSVEVHRGNGEFVKRSVNFLTRRVSTVTTNIEVDTDPPAVWTRLPAGPLLTMDQVGDGLEFKPVPEDGCPFRPSP